MKSLFQLEKDDQVPELSKGLGPILYLVSHCVKSKYEACVLEGYGSTIERHASKLCRNQEQENYSAEALLHINGPLLLHDADHLIKRVLNLHFGKNKQGVQKLWHFSNTAGSLAKNAHVLKNADESMVMKRLYGTKSKASFTAGAKKRKVEGGSVRGGCC